MQPGVLSDFRLLLFSVRLFENGKLFSWIRSMEKGRKMRYSVFTLKNDLKKF